YFHIITTGLGISPYFFNRAFDNRKKFFAVVRRKDLEVLYHREKTVSWTGHIHILSLRFNKFAVLLSRHHRTRKEKHRPNPIHLKSVLAVQQQDPSMRLESKIANSIGSAW